MSLKKTPPLRFTYLRAWLAALFLPAALLAFPPISAANENAHNLGAASEVTKKPLQELVKKRREKGLIYVTIPQARVYGEGSGYRPYCSPQIRAINSSHKTIDEMIAGILYRGPDGKPVGSTVTRFHRVKVGKQDTHYFYSTISANHCNGLTGDLEIVRCVYDNGVDCTDDVRAVVYGAVPLQVINRDKENK